MYYQPQIDFTPEEILDYLRKSQSDDPLLTIEEVLAKHETILDRWDERHLGEKVPKSNRFYEIVSGESLSERTEFQKILRMIESPKYRAVKVVDVARLSRGDLEDIGRIMKIFKLTDTLIITPERIYDLRDEYDWNAIEGELKQSSSYLTYYKKIQKRGKELSFSQGNFLGSIPPYGFDKTTVIVDKRKCPTLKENKEQADVVRMIFDLYVNKNMGQTEIGYYLDKLGIRPMNGEYWSPTAIKEMLKNVHYIGKVRWNWRKTVSVVDGGEIKKVRQKGGDNYAVAEGRHEGIIPLALFNAAQDKLGKRHRATAKNKVKNPFAGLIQCRCGRAVIYQVGKGSGTGRLYCSKQTHCGSGSCSFDEVVSIVRQELAAAIADFEVHIQNDDGNAVKIHANLISNLENKLIELEKKELAQWEMQSHPDESKRMPHEIFKKLNEKLLHDKEETRQALKRARETMPEPVDYERKILMFRDALDALKDPLYDPEEKNNLLKICIEKIYYHRERPVRQKPAEGNGKFPMIDTQWTSPPIELDIHFRG